MNHISCMRYEVESQNIVLKIADICSKFLNAPNAKS